MKIGFVGLGKLGLPCAVGMALKGHDVVGYDIDNRCASKEPKPYREAGADRTSDFNLVLARSTIRFGPLAEVVEHAEILFIAVQTPHEARFDGTALLDSSRADFDYSILVRAVQQVARSIKREIIVSVISTVLPRTIRAHVLPLLPPPARVAYNPYFISMGTVLYDFFHPEFVLCGTDDAAAAAKLQAFYRTISPAPFVGTSIENAELIKLTYNTYISTKIAFANTIMEICHKIPGADADVVTAALKLGTERITSGKYLSGGMGDGGGCHPRDNIAMSWFAQELGLRCDWFGQVMSAREQQAAWLADLMEEYDLPKAIVGYSFKAESNVVQGSAALLLKNILEQRGHHVFTYDPLVDGPTIAVDDLPPMVFLIGVNHQAFRSYRFPSGSVVIDPWRFLDGIQPEVRLVSVGRSPSLASTPARLSAAIAG